MTLKFRLLGLALALLVGGCAKGGAALDASTGPGTDGTSGDDDAPTTCTGASCDDDMDGVPNFNDHCANTPAGQVVNQVGCSDGQLTATLDPRWPPYNLAWTSAGDLGRATSLTWTYTGIDRGDLFHIYWIICDDPATPCGISLDGPIDVASENWTYDAADSNLAGGKVVFTNATHILLADGSSPALNGRLTMTIVDASNVAIAFADVGALHVTARSGTYGAEIAGVGFQVVALAEVQDPTTLAWSPYLDYYDAAATPDTGGTASVSFGGSFYDK